MDASVNNINNDDYKVFLPVRVNETRVKAMLDSGNVFRIVMSKKLSDQLGIRKSHLRPLPGYTTIDTAAEGAQLEVLGETRKKLRLNLGGGTKDIFCRPVVLDRLSMDLNISGPFMKKHGIDLIQTRGVATVQGKELELVTKADDVATSTGTYSMIYTADDVVVKSMEALWISAIAPAVESGAMPTDHLLVTGDGQFVEQYDLHPMSNSIVNCNKQGKLSVLIMNTNGREVKVKGGSLYGAGFCTTTKDKMLMEKDKICVLQPEDKKSEHKYKWVPEPKICDMNAEPCGGKGRWKEDNMAKEVKEEEKAKDGKATLDENVQKYMEGDQPLPKYMSGPNTSGNRAKRVAFLIEYFQLKNNPVLKDKDDLAAAIAVLLRYWDLWAFNGNYGHTALLEHGIDVEPGTVPIYEKYRPPNPLLEESMKKQLDMWKRHGVVKPSSSPWNFNLLAAVKKGMKIRWCCDWRRLNRVTIKDRFPIGNCDLNLSKLGKSRIYSTIDAMGAFHCVGIKAHDMDKTSFSTPWGTYMFAKMGFGLCNAPSTYARLVAMVLNGIPMTVAIPFLDDLILHSPTVQTHIKSIEAVFKAYRRANLRLNPRKCTMFSQTAEYLGHLVSPEGISPTKDYIKIIQDWPFPRCRTALRQWIGKCSYYRKFIKDFAGIAKPLLEKLSKDVGPIRDSDEYEVTPEMEKSFDELKKRLTSAPILAYPEFGDLQRRPFKLYTDWSGINNSIGGVLCQDDEKGDERVISYAGRRLNKSQRNYSATKGELCAILTMMEIFRYFLQFSEFILRTDHHALRWLQSFQQPTGLYARWQARLESFNFKVEHWPGKKNVVADSLSRAPHLVHDPKDDLDVFNEKEDVQHLNQIGAINANSPAWNPRMVREAQEEDKDLQEIRKLIMRGQKPTKDATDAASINLKTYYGLFNSLYIDKTGVLRYKYQLGSTPFDEKPTSRDLLVLPAELAADAVKVVHEQGAHMAVDSTVERAMRHVYALNLNAITRRVLAKCIQCQQARGRPQPQRHTLYSTLQGYPWQRLTIDYVGPITRSTRGNRYLLTVQDAFSRWLEAFPVANATAKVTLDILNREIFTRYGLPESIHSDRGSTFVANIVKEVCDTLHISQSTTVPYNPSNNRIERHHRTLGKMLTTLTEGRQQEWEEVLPHALFAHRTHVNRVTGFAPYSLMFNRDPRTELDLIFQKPNEETMYNTYEDYAEALRARMLRAQAWAREHIGEAVRRQRRAYCQARKVYKVGDRVWLFSPKRKIGQSSKFKISWTGPWSIRSKINDLTYELAPHPSWPRQRYEKVGIDRIQEYRAAEEDEDHGGTPPATDDDLTMPGDELAEETTGVAREEEDEESDDDYTFNEFVPDQAAPPQPQGAGGNANPPQFLQPAPAMQIPDPPRTPPREALENQPHTPDIWLTPPDHVDGEVDAERRKSRKDQKRGQGQKVREAAYRGQKKEEEEIRKQGREARDSARGERLRKREETKQQPR